MWAKNYFKRTDKINKCLGYFENIDAGGDFIMSSMRRQISADIRISIAFWFPFVSSVNLNCIKVHPSFIHISDEINARQRIRWLSEIWIKYAKKDFKIIFVELCMKLIWLLINDVGNFVNRSLHVSTSTNQTDF